MLWNAEQIQFVGYIEKNQISKKLNEKIYNVQTQYCFAEQINKLSKIS